MDATTLLITLSCLVDEWLAGAAAAPARPQPDPGRQRGPDHRMRGRVLRIDTDKGLYDHFGRCRGDWFPALGRAHRTTFTRLAACGRS
jgi:hypothetical protein